MRNRKKKVLLVICAFLCVGAIAVAVSACAGNSSQASDSTLSGAVTSIKSKNSSDTTTNKESSSDENEIKSLKSKSENKSESESTEEETQTTDGIKTVIIGDSYCAGYALGGEPGAETEDISKGWAAQLSNMLNLDSSIYAVTGMGFAQSKPGHIRAIDLIEEIADDSSLNKDEIELVIVGMGVNDANTTWYGHPASARKVYKAVYEAFTSLDELFPNAKIVFVPVLETKYGSFPSREFTYAADVAAAKACGCVDQIITGATHWLEGMDNVTVSYDNWHPNEYGNFIIASKIADQLLGDA